ncbi:MAG: hypothetical protein MI748_14870, partial [Opitutales bacterium]|nr:hypothetical protein [Opitutales bacterium]
ASDLSLKEMGVGSHQSLLLLLLAIAGTVHMQQVLENGQVARIMVGQLEFGYFVFVLDETETVDVHLEYGLLEEVDLYLRRDAPPTELVYDLLYTDPRGTTRISGLEAGNWSLGVFGADCLFGCSIEVTVTWVRIALSLTVLTSCILKDFTAFQYLWEIVVGVGVLACVLCCCCCALYYAKGVLQN